MIKQIKVEDAVGTILAHDMTRIERGRFKGVGFKKGHVVLNTSNVTDKFTIIFPVSAHRIPSMGFTVVKCYIRLMDHLKMIFHSVPRMLVL